MFLLVSMARGAAAPSPFPIYRMQGNPLKSLVCAAPASDATQISCRDQGNDIVCDSLSLAPDKFKNIGCPAGGVKTVYILPVSYVDPQNPGDTISCISADPSSNPDTNLLCAKTNLALACTAPKKGAPIQCPPFKAIYVAADASASTQTDDKQASKAGAGAHANLVASSQNGTASFKYTGDFGPSHLPNDKNGVITGADYGQASVTASSPVSKASSTTELATQDSLANAAALSVEYAYYWDTWGVKSRDSLWIFGGYAKPAYQQFKYISASTLGSEAALTKKLSSATQTTSKIPDAFGVYLGRTIFGPDMLFAHVDYQHAYTDATTGVLCPSPKTGSNSATTCATGPVGLPTQTEKLLSTVEYKYYDRAGIFQTFPVAFDLSLIYDSKSSTRSFDLPIYFISTGTPGSLIGGIDVGWTSATRKATIGVVISTPFILTQPRQ
jgi:hypothetical protein